MKHLAKYFSFLALFLANVFPCIALAYDVKIHGTVRYSDGTAAESANVIIRDTSESKVFGFANVMDDGSYEISYSGNEQVIRIMVSGFNVRSTYRDIPAKDAEIDFTVEFAALSIKEAVVTANSIERKHDTLVYNVSSFKSGMDATIGDVMKKMPGIDIAENGRVLYNGMDIGKFYIEGMDMLGGKYGIAVENIRAEDISSVEVLENHQPVKILEDIVSPDNASINIRLKESAAGAWNVKASAGIGYEPVLWDGYLAGMLFSEKFQALGFYKTNNCGETMASLPGAIPAESAIFGIRQSFVPDIDKPRYINNNSHAISANALSKLKNGAELTAGIQYSYESASSKSEAVTCYYLQEGQPFEIRETNNASYGNHNLSADMTYRLNGKNTYLTEKLSFLGCWDSGSGNIRTEGSDVAQSMSHKQFALQNDFSIKRRFKKMILDFSSRIRARSSSPFLQVFENEDVSGASENKDGNPAGRAQAYQGNSIYTLNSLSSSFVLKNWNLGVEFNANARIENMETSLSYPQMATVADSMKNDMSYKRMELAVSPFATFHKGGFFMDISLPAGFIGIWTNDAIRHVAEKTGRPVLMPSVNMRYDISYEFRLYAEASYKDYYDGLSDSYAGYIMKDYLTVSANPGSVEHSGRQNYSLSATWSDAFNAIFANLKASYGRSSYETIKSLDLEPGMIISENRAMKNTNQGFSVAGGIEKKIPAISSSLGINGGYARNYGKTMRQDFIMDNISDIGFVTFEIHSAFRNIASFDYSINYSCITGVSGNNRIDAMHSLRQGINMDFNILKNLALRISGNHYYNGAVEHKNYFFIDAGIVYKHKNIEYHLEAKNLMNERTYVSENYINGTIYHYSYGLRPLSAMLKVVFAIR